MQGDVFGLNRIYEQQVRNVENKNFASWPEGGLYGYFGGGTPNGLAQVCIIDRLDFSTETVTTPSPKLNRALSNLSAVSSNSYGYFGGGSFSPPTTAVCTINRLDFSTETVTTSTPLNLTRAVSSTAALSNSSYGYFSGGIRPVASGGPTIYATGDRLDFSSETLSNSFVVSGPSYGHAATSSSSYGYFGSVGNNGFQSSTLNRFDFSTQTVSIPGPKLSSDNLQLSATSSNSYGYFGGGLTPTVRVCTIDRLDFSTETVTTPGPKLSQARGYLAAVSSSSYGYFGGGYEGFVGSICTIDRLDFSTETVSTPGPKLSQAREFLAATSNSN